MKPSADFSQDFTAGFIVRETLGRTRRNQGVRTGMPFPRGLVFDAEEIAVFDQHAAIIPHQFRVMASWPDRSIKWLLVDALACVEAGHSATLSVRQKSATMNPEQRGSWPSLHVTEERNGFVVDTGAARFRIERGAFSPISGVSAGSADELLSPTGSSIRLRCADGKAYDAFTDSMRVEESGAVRASILVDGDFVNAGGRRIPLLFRARLGFLAGSSGVTVEFLVRNPRAAQHPGGVWDLGGDGSLRFTDLSILLRPHGTVRDVAWNADILDPLLHSSDSQVCLYQDSSGGRNWDSLNHVDSAGGTTVKFSGYEVRSGTTSDRRLVAEGARATPCLQVSTDAGWIAATTRDFWQNFPKALRLEEGALSVGLFPSECSAAFELQGGEQKRHVIYLDFGLRDREPRIDLLQVPLVVSVDPAWIERSEAIAWFTAGAPEEFDEGYSQYVGSIVEGADSFFQKREVVDEYGWRNFGDLYADHEAVHHRGVKPMVSHYNNQYDFIYGAGVQYLRTGDSRWQVLMEDAARHTIDIDIYHTTEDRAAYSGGLFWHTDHYKDAATCTHRTYSRRNGGRNYGGGPSNEHNYTSGLLQYYYLSGDPEAAGSVMDLANWVMAMDDGSRNILGLVDSSPTGLASNTVSANFHGPGRGAGNSINALLDAYKLGGDRKYVAKAEELIQRCIHPSDDVPALKLDEPEYRWSYLVFLQVLGKYLDFKRELGEIDYHYQYARESLLHYADWMLAAEVPYKDVLDKVELPTETWPAHDIRKCHVLHIASMYADPATRDALKQRAGFFFGRCMRDLLSFETAYLTRPLVIICVYGHVHRYFQKRAASHDPLSRHNYNFGEPHRFQSQRERLASEIKRKVRLAASETKRVLGEKFSRLGNRSKAVP